VGRRHKAFTVRTFGDSIPTALLGDKRERSPRSLALPRDDNGLTIAMCRVGRRHKAFTVRAIGYSVPTALLGDKKERSPRSLTLPCDDNEVDYLNVEIG